MKNLIETVHRHAGWLAAACCALAAWAFGHALAGYSHAQYPLAFLGARGFPQALAFNLLGFVVPGALAAAAAMALRARLPGDARWPARIGARLLMLSALAFAAQGLLPLDPDDLDGPRSQWHATAWTLWWIAAGTGAALLGGGLWRRSGWRALAGMALASSVLVVVVALAPPGLWPAGIGQRIAFGAWLGLWIVAARVPSGRGAAQP
ncbi:DUF998 domain-containing protein [Lysobacter koreensis]|uniref:DUF998 domain-containing protein n=1 Tax=Lysobacter koreensis TaxID=266122 RepID=A0ABW2YMS9_9GAMM